MKFTKRVIIFFIFGIIACSSSLSDKEAVNLAKKKHFDRKLEDMKEYDDQVTRSRLLQYEVTSEVLSNDGDKAKVKLTVSEKSAPRIGFFPEPYSVEVEVTRPK